MRDGDRNRVGPPADERDGPLPGRALCARIRRFVDAGDPMVACRVGLVAREAAEPGIGPSPDPTTDRIVEATIERALTPADMYARVSPDRYLIVFCRLAVAEVRARCARIAEALDRRLADEGAPIRAEIVVAAIDEALGSETITDPGLLLAAFERTSGPRVGEDAGDGPPAAAAAPDEDPLKDVRLVYRPMWDIGRNVVSTYVYMPSIPLRDGGLAVGETAISRIDEASVAFDLDLLVVQKLVQDLMELQASGRRLLLAAPVHFETMASTGRRAAFLRFCEVVSPALQQLVLFELIGVPAGVPQFRLLEIATLLKRNARAVLLRTPLADAQVRGPAETGIGIVGVNVGDYRGTERAAMKAMDRFCERAQKAGLQTYAHGLRTMSLTTAAVAAGFDYVDGDTVTSIVDEPGGLYRFDTRSLFKGRAPARRGNAPGSEIRR